MPRRTRSPVLAIAGAPVDRLQTVAEGPDWYHPGRVGSLMLGPKNRLASFGEIHPRVLDVMDTAGPLVAFEVDLDAIPLPKSNRTARPALDAPDLQAVTRDFAFVVAQDVSADRILRAAKAADKALIASVSIFDVFEGEAIGAGRKSVAVEVTLQPRRQTLTEAEIEQVLKLDRCRGRKGDRGRAEGLSSRSGDRVHLLFREGGRNNGDRHRKTA
jgi:phenylalanyl-tRNA synthetase beta chain